jgi:hypothetical protein
VSQFFYAAAKIVRVHTVSGDAREACSMRVWPWLLLCLTSVSACNRTEEPHSSGDAQAAGQPLASAKPAATSAPQPQAACVVPMAEEPARRAPNA